MKEKLMELKGDGSYSDVIESLLNKTSIVMPDSRPKHRPAQPAPERKTKAVSLL
ncbi:MAG: hypothetical protein KAR20_13825 [Candidatus Heimdallarchaeota archaeon]|nr:hypothetical protein [Candidatus Heimdallarchaeota archaeon]